MKKSSVVLLLAILISQACGQSPSLVKADGRSSEVQIHATPFISPSNTILTRFQIPEGYERKVTDSSSFATFLRNLQLKEKDAPVKYYDGRIKPNNKVYAAVVDLPIGKRDLHQCADAVMRLRAQYLYEQKKYDSIHFNFTNGFLADYSNWRSGKRIVVKGNLVEWKPGGLPSDSPEDFWKYLEMVFSYAGTASLEKEMKSIALSEMRIGDVFIQGGFPGHAVIVVDLAVHKTTKEKTFLLAQSYMPAQEIQILHNPNHTGSDAWYDLSDISNSLITPEWTFDRTHLKRFSN